MNNAYVRAQSTLPAACRHGRIHFRTWAMLAFACLAAQPANAATAVGRISGAFDSTATGGATYTIPIQVAPGMNGLKPSIALAYHSQAGDGLAGLGWTVSGFPEIARCGLTRALDGRAQGVRFTAQDRFCLDGHPLVLLGGTHGTEGAVYSSEVHAYERVIAHGRQGSGPAWFEVRSPDGMVYRYGNDADSRVEAAGTTEVRAWALNEMEDRYQQRIGVAYTEDDVNGEHVPAEIRWTYGAGETFSQARYRLIVRWEPRPAAEVRGGYLWGSPWRASQRVSAIDYEFDDGGGFRRVHRYALDYGPADGNGRSQVRSITQCGPLDCLAATTMEWDQAPSDRSTETITSIPVEGAVFGDFNGDGATDVFGGYQGRWAVWPANPQTGGFLAPVVIGGAFGTTSVGAALDYNGDGLTDLMAGSSQGPNWLVYLAPATPGAAFQVKNTGVAWSASGEVEPMDVDADGLDDLVYLRDGMAYLRRNTGGVLTAEQASGIAPVAAPLTALGGSYGFVESADFDGDGRRDLLVARSRASSSRYSWEAFLSTGTGFARDPIATFTTSLSRWNVLVLDMNGDGLSDVLRYDAGTWQPLISHGTGTGAGPGLAPANCPSPLTEPAGNKVAALDTDADGRSEIIIRSRNGYWALHTSDGNCFSSVDGYRIISSPNSIDYGRVVPIDSDGDGNPDVMFGSTGLKRWVLSRPVLPTRPDGVTIARRAGLLQQITDGLGNSHETDYRTLSGWSGYQASGVAVAQARLLRGGPLPVVSEYTTNTGAGTERYRVSFSYSNLRMDTAGRGMLGFGSINATDSRTGLATETVYRQDFPFAGRTDKVTISDGARKVSVYDPTWSVSTTAAPDAARDVHFVHLASELTESYEVDAGGGLQGGLVRSTSRALTWNFNHGAIAVERTRVTSPQQAGATYRTTRTATLDEGLRSSAGCLGFPTRVDLTREVPGAATQTRTALYSYDPATCRVAISAEGPTNAPAQQLWTIYMYDARGRTQTVVRTDGASALPPRQTRVSYDGAGFRPTAEAYAIQGEPDLVVTHAWNDGLGLETSRTSAQGATTAWQYDEFGRVRSELRPTGSTRTGYAGCGPCFAPNARYMVRQQRADGYWSETQHDSFGRIVGRAFVLPDGAASRQNIEYGSLGQVARESLPYVGGAAPLYWTTWDRDLLGRPKSVEQPVSVAAPSGAISSITYAGTSVTVRDAELRSTVYAHDAEGRLTSVRPPLGGGATYAYDAFGQLTSIADAAGHVRQFGYDERGLVTASIDPDAGRRAYAYNAFGEMVTQSDGRTPPAVTTMHYDQLGRMTSRSEPEGVTSWTYGAAAGPSRGQLLQVTGPTEGSATGFRESYVYDGQGRLQRASTVIDGSSYLTDYTHDGEGKLASMTYPATIGWRPKFVFGYSNGHLVSIAQETPALTPVYTLLAMDPQGHDAAVRFGNGAIEERIVHDAASARLTAIRSGAPASPASLQNYAYEWDRVGNLLARQDLGASPAAEERFTYDDLNRMTRATLNGAQTLAVTYSPDGNILSKSDVGNYTYGAGSQYPHALGSVSGGPRGSMTFSYDANGNMSVRNGAAIAWTSFNRPKQVNAGGDYAKFTYGPDRARVRQDLKAGTGTKTIHYVGPHFEVEIEGATRRYRANVFAYGRAVYSQVETTPNGLDAYYVRHEHQGSVDRLVRAVGGGSDRLALSFDAWGKRRNPNWTADTGDQRYADGHWLERGYTGHEHLDNVRLVHMSGRVEDPLLGRMLSPDPVPGSLAGPQALNPYSYVANGPVSFVDPSGYFLERIGNFFQRVVSGIGSFTRRLVRNYGRQIAAVAAAYFTAGAASSWANAAHLPDVAVSIGSTTLAADGMAVAGTLTAAVPSGVVIGGIAGGAVAGAISSGNARGAAFGALTGSLMAGIGGYYGGSYSAGRVLAEAAVGGVSADVRGGDFRSGFLTSGALSSLTWASLEMRRIMIEQSRLNPANASGPSAGFQGDEFKLGGCRAPCRSSPLGGVQGQPGSLFGIDYGAGSFLDHLIETYAGPHDFLNAPFFYDQLGNNIGRPALFNVINGGNVLVATPFAGASVIPSYAYGSFGD